MALQLDFPATRATEQAGPIFRRIGESRPEEPAVPVYRYLLSGGSRQFQLSVRSVATLIAFSLIAIPSAQVLTGRSAFPAATVGLAIATAIISLPLAALVTHWAGRTSGVQAGWLVVLGWTVTSFLDTTGQVLGAGAAISAILVYGLAELPNRGTALPRAPAVHTFYSLSVLSCLLSGPAALTAISVVCLGTVLGNGNSRDMRFFASPVGVMILIGGMATSIWTRAASDAHVSSLWYGQPGHLWPIWLAVPSLALGAVLALASHRSGHGASPLGRFLTSWLLGPAVLGTVGVLPVHMAIAITLPAWATMAGIAMTDLRRGRRVKRV